MQPEDIEGQWTDNQGNYYSIKSSWLYVKTRKRDLMIKKRGKHGVFLWKVKDHGDYWELIVKKEKWRLKKNSSAVVWVGPKGKMMRFYKFPEVLHGEWTTKSDGGVIKVKDGMAIFPSGGKYEMRDGGSVWEMIINREVFVLDKVLATQNSSTSIKWVSTVNGEEISWIRRPTANHAVSDWGAYLTQKANGKAREDSGAHLFTQGDEIVLTDKNPLWKNWHWVKGHVVTRKEGGLTAKIIIKLSGLGKVLEVAPSDIALVKNGLVVLTPSAANNQQEKLKSKREYYSKLLQGKWMNSDGLEIKVEDKYAIFSHSKNQYRIIYEAQPPLLMIGNVEWELRTGQDENRVFWTNFKDRIEWFRKGKLEPLQPAFVTPGIVPFSKPASAPPKYEEISKWGLASVIRSMSPAHNGLRNIVPQVDKKRQRPAYEVQSDPSAPPSYEEAVPPSYYKAARNTQT